MNRRGFLRTCLGSVAAVVAAPLAVRASERPITCWDVLTQEAEIDREIRELVQAAKAAEPDWQEYKFYRLYVEDQYVEYLRAKTWDGPWVLVERYWVGMDRLTFPGILCPAGRLQNNTLDLS